MNIDVFKTKTIFTSNHLQDVPPKKKKRVCHGRPSHGPRKLLQEHLPAASGQIVPKFTKGWRSVGKLDPFLFGTCIIS